jgi:hypothetical protein
MVACFVTLYCHPIKAKPIEYQWVILYLAEEEGLRGVIPFGVCQAEAQGRSALFCYGSVASKEKILVKYKDVVDLVKKSDLPLRRIASITNRSINTVAKVKLLI